MSKQNNVPKFGNWDANAQVPFTLVFEKARADKSTGTRNKIVNPNDPFDSLGTFGIKAEDIPPSRRSSQQQYAEDVGGVRVNSGRGRPYASGGPLRPSMAKLSNSGSHGSASSNEGAGFGDDNGSAEQSPNHPASAFKGRLGNRPVSSSLSPDKRGSAESGPLHQAAPAARTRFRPSSRGEEMPDKTAALPKFGEWDENDPTSGEGFTIIFSHARNEKKVGGPARIPALQSDTAAKMNHADFYKQPQHPIHRKASSWTCCFQPPNVM